MGHSIAVPARTAQGGITPGIYRSYDGLLVVVSMLVLITAMGFASYFYDSLLLIQLGTIFIILTMAFDLGLVQTRILKKKMYLAHHLVTMFWASIGFFYLESIMYFKPGIFAYMLLGALFRRALKISKDLAPGREWLHNIIYRLMVFSDFCDPLIILLLWDWLQELSAFHRYCYFGLACIRIIINSQAYPALNFSHLYKKSLLEN